MCLTVSCVSFCLPCLQDVPSRHSLWKLRHKKGKISPHGKLPHPDGMERSFPPEPATIQIIGMKVCGFNLQGSEKKSLRAALTILIRDDIATIEIFQS